MAIVFQLFKFIMRLVLWATLITVIVGFFIARYFMKLTTEITRELTR